VKGRESKRRRRDAVDVHVDASRGGGEGKNDDDLAGDDM